MPIPAASYSVFRLNADVTCDCFRHWVMGAGSLHLNPEEIVAMDTVVITLS